MLGPAAVFLTATATGLDILITHPGHAVLRLVLVLTAYAGFALMLAVQRAQPFLTRRLVLAALLPLLGLAVAIPPHGSQDLWSYVMEGRTVSVHHHSPYRLAPDQTGPDPLLARVAPRWRHQPAVYGPGFIAAAAVITRLAGTSPIALRLAFQVLAAAAALACVVVVGRKTGDPGAMAWLGLNPGLCLFVVNLGHNDLLVGAAVLIAILIAVERPAVAGAVVGLAALVKIVGLLALVALAVSVAGRVGRRAGATLAGVGVCVVAAGYALAGGTAAALPLRTASQWHTPGSLAAASLALLPHINDVLVCQALVAIAVVVLLVRGHAEPHWLVTAVVVAYLLGAPYILPWYTAWALPAAALAWRSRLSLLIVVQSAALAVISVDNRTLAPNGLHIALSTATRTILPALEILGLVVLMVTVLGRGRRREPTLSTA